MPRCSRWARPSATRASCPAGSGNWPSWSWPRTGPASSSGTRTRPAGRLAGLREEELAAFRDRRQPDLADPAESASVRAAWALVQAGDLDEQEYADAVAHLGPAGLFELSTLVGYYSMLALQLRIFRADGPPSS